jgi:hypothetical protein
MKQGSPMQPPSSLSSGPAEISLPEATTELDVARRPDNRPPLPPRRVQAPA